MGVQRQRTAARVVGGSSEDEFSDHFLGVQKLAKSFIGIPFTSSHLLHLIQVLRSACDVQIHLYPFTKSLLALIDISTSSPSPDGDFPRHPLRNGDRGLEPRLVSGFVTYVSRVYLGDTCHELDRSFFRLPD